MTVNAPCAKASPPGPRLATSLKKSSPAWQIKKRTASPGQLCSCTGAAPWLLFLSALSSSPPASGIASASSASPESTPARRSCSRCASPATHSTPFSNKISNTPQRKPNHESKTHCHRPYRRPAHQRCRARAGQLPLPRNPAKEIGRPRQQLYRGRSQSTDARLRQPFHGQKKRRRGPEHDRKTQRRLCPHLRVQQAR